MDDADHRHRHGRHDDRRPDPREGRLHDLHRRRGTSTCECDRVCPPGCVVTRYRAQGAHCPLGSLLAQAGGTPGAYEVVRTLLAQWRTHVAAGIEAMQAAGQIRAELDASRTASAFIAGIQGRVQVLRSTGSVEDLEAVLDTLIDYLRGPGSPGVTY